MTDGFLVTSSQKGLLTLALMKILYRSRNPIAYYVRSEASPGQLSRLDIFLLSHIAERVLCVSQRTYNNLSRIGIDARKLRVVLTSVDVDDLLNETVALPDLGKPTIQILFAASLIPGKGLHHLIDALGQVRDITRFRLTVAGAAPNATHDSYVNSLYEAASRLPPGIIKWLGWVNDVHGLIKEADIVCLPSYTEGFPRIVIESMAMGRLVVASPVGGIPELIDHKTSGYITSLDAKSLATLLDHISNSSDTDKISQTARDSIRHRYSLSKQGCMVLDALTN